MRTGKLGCILKISVIRLLLFICLFVRLMEDHKSNLNVVYKTSYPRLEKYNSLQDNCNSEGQFLQRDTSEIKYK